MPRWMKSHTVVADGAVSGSMRSSSRVETSWPFFDCSAGASPPPMPALPWQPTHPFCWKTVAPSLAVPWPWGSSSPIGPIEISRARISAGVGVRPTPYVGDWAKAGLPRSNAIATNLSESIGHSPISVYPPGHHAVVQPRHSVVSIKRHVPVFGDLLSRRLLLPDLVGAAGNDLGFVAIPMPRITEPCVRHALRRRLDLGAVPLPPAIGGHLHVTNGAPAGPGQPADLVKSAAGQLLSAGRFRDDRFGSDLEAERGFLRSFGQMSVVVIVQIIPVDDLDAPQPLGVKDSLVAGGHQTQRITVLGPHGLAVHAVGDEAVVHRLGDGHARGALHFLGAFGDEPRRAAFEAALLEQRGKQHPGPFGATGHPVRFLHILLPPIVPVSRTLDEVQPCD